MTRYTPQWLQAGSYAASLDRRLISALWPTAASSGCAVTFASGMTVNIAAGQVAVPSQNNTGSSLCTTDATEQATLTAAPPSGQSRIDLIVCQPRGADLDGGANTDFIFAAVAGTPATTGSQVVPAVPAGTAALAQILVPGGSASITPANITDARPGGLPISSQATPTSMPRGFVGYAINATAVNIGTSSATPVSLTVPVVAGRRYRAMGYLAGSLASGTAVITASLNGVDTAPRVFAFGNSITTGIAAGSMTFGTLSPSASGNVTFSISGFTTAGTFNVAANNAWILVEDIGSQ